MLFNLLFMFIYRFGRTGKGIPQSWRLYSFHGANFPTTTSDTSRPSCYGKRLQSVTYLNEVVTNTQSARKQARIMDNNICAKAMITTHPQYQGVGFVCQIATSENQNFAQ